MWSFGILLEELTLGRAPYANMSLTSVILTTLHQDAPTLATQKTKRGVSEVRPALQDFPLGTEQRTLESRKSAAWTLSTPRPCKAPAPPLAVRKVCSMAPLKLWPVVQELHDIVRQCLQKDPALRPTCSQLLRHKFFKVPHQAPPPACCWPICPALSRITR